jgi:Domain of unknown function (DUF4326)
VPGAVYIGRKMPRCGLTASAWANPYKIGRDGKGDTRTEVIARYRDEWLPTHPDLLGQVEQLRGHALACWCVPRGSSLPGKWQGKTCHGEVLAALVDSVERGFAVGMLRAGLCADWDWLQDMLLDLLADLVAHKTASWELSKPWEMGRPGEMGKWQERSAGDAVEDSADR